MPLAHDLRDLAGQELRLETGALVFLEAADGLAQGRIGRGRFVRHLLDAGGREAGREIARFDEDDLDAVAPHFNLQGFAKTFDRELAGRIEALERQAHHAADGAEAEDLSPTLPAHGGKHGLGKAHLAHEIRIHLQLDIVFRREFHRTADTHAGIVDQHVDASFG